jgi:hypothetical protein
MSNELEKPESEVKLEKLEREVKALRRQVKQLIERQPPHPGWVSMQDFLLMLGRTRPDGTRKPIARKTFQRYVEESKGAIKLTKLGRLVFITDYPEKQILPGSEAAA